MDEFKSHIDAAKAGCPLCKKPLKDLWTNRLEGNVWRNKCQDGKCPGYRDYCVTYELQAAQKEAEAPAQQRHKGKPKAPTAVAADDWAFVDDYNRWRNVKGEVVRLKELSDDELLDAMYLLKEHNFAKIGSSIAWMKDLPRKPGIHGYPKDALSVGKDMALAKLEEMQEIAVQKGLLGTST